MLRIVRDDAPPPRDTAVPRAELPALERVDELAGHLLVLARAIAVHRRLPRTERVRVAAAHLLDAAGELQRALLEAPR